MMETMKITNEHRHVPLALPGDRSAEGIVQVRGVDLRFGGRGVVFEDRRPVAVLVRTPDTLRRIAIDEHRRGRRFAAYAAPVAVYTLARLLLRRRRVS